ncbi:relaxase/mobilization nuclease domain-containing protein [Rubricoccus marinus]|uniref:Relaxase n=1 Tax=Rubricoccus marinus TaxID=716817 RepID=A0A259TTS7_9BACT|nr:relaxase/mobilization nuclease domain-containing protein [Rubricoccus marinus]OZC01125.1 hypothetical protein BSZ36_18555 [Rubricoccus marinus]
MIGAASTGASFQALGTYLVGDESRVGWVETRNTLARDPRAVVAEMERDVALSRSRVEKPVYHLALSFDPTDAPTRDELRGAVDRTLQDLGLGDHPALVVAHTDTDHAHVHVMVSRVGADGKAWSTSFSNRRLRTSIETQERELGVRWTGRNAELTRAPSVERGTADVPTAETPSGRDRGFAADVRSRALADLRTATSWRDLDARLAAHGLRVERKGRGAVVTDGTREAKLSSVSRSVSRPKLEARFGPLRAHEEDREVLPRHVEESGTRRTAPSLASSRTRSGRSPRRSGAALRIGKGIVRSVDLDGGQSGDERIARAPKTVASRSVRRVGRRAAKRVVVGSARTLTQRTLARRSAHRDLRPGGRLDRLAAMVAERSRLARLKGQWGAVLGLGTRERERAATQLAGLRDTAERSGQSFVKALGSVYADPSAAAHAFSRAAVRDGLASTAERMAAAPDSFGPLRTEKRPGLGGAFRSASDGPARAAAPAAAERGAAYVRSNDAYAAASRQREAPSPLAAAAGRRESRARAVLFAGKSGPGSRGKLHSLDGRIGRAFQRLGQQPDPASRTAASARRTAKVARSASVRLGSVGLGVATAAARSVVRGLGR